MQGDFETLSNTVTIPAGSTSAPIDVRVVNDLMVESSENVTVTLSGVSGSKATLDNINKVQTVVITDADTAQVVIQNVANAKEPGGTANDGKFNVSLVNVGHTLPMRSSTQTLVPFTVLGIGTAATYNVDYTLSGANVSFNSTTLKGTVTIPAGETRVSIDVTVINENAVEDDEFVTISLDSASNDPIQGDPQITASTVTAAVTIQDDDAAVVRVNNSINGMEPNTKGQFFIDLVRSLDNKTIAPNTSVGDPNGFNKYAPNAYPYVTSNADVIVNYTVTVGSSPVATPGALVATKQFLGGFVRQIVTQTPVTGLAINDFVTISTGDPLFDGAFQVTAVGVNSFWFGANPLGFHGIPNGSGSLSPIDGWSGSGSTGTYRIDLTGAKYASFDPVNSLTIFDNDVGYIRVTATNGKERVGNGAPVQFTITQNLAASTPTVVTYTLSSPGSNAFSTVANPTLVGPLPTDPPADHLSEYSKVYTATIPATLTSVVVTVPVVDDLIVESNTETVVLQLGSILSTSASAFIEDNDSATVTISSVLAGTEPGGTLFLGAPLAVNQKSQRELSSRCKPRFRIYWYRAIGLRFSSAIHASMARLT